MMEWGGSAALGGMMTSLMLGAWALGRWQGPLRNAALPEDGAPTAPSPTATLRPGPGAPARVPHERSCQEAARIERRSASDCPDSLGELHADMVAYRRAQRALVDADSASLWTGRLGTESEEACRYLGVSGQPTCPSIVLKAEELCACRACHPAGRPAPAARGLLQPSPEPPPLFTRV